MNFLIIGSGFGIYGYLPAVYKFSKQIYLSSKYKAKFYSRVELLKYEKKIFWYDQINSIIKNIDYAILAKRPNDQLSLVKHLYNKKKFKHIFLEKPLDVNPMRSSKILLFLKKKKIKYSIGFIFKYLKWYNLIKKNKDTANFNIIWNIKKNLKSNLWKYDIKKGGGLLRFYGIHFIYLFNDLKYIHIVHCKSKYNTFEISLINKKKKSINVKLNFSKFSSFIIKKNNKLFLKSQNPFLKKITENKVDPRIKILRKYVIENINYYKNSIKNDINLNKLWSRIENVK